jgi:quinol monooxygenase YgiN
MKLNEATPYLYCTAVIQSTGKVPYAELTAALKKLCEQTVKEPGCILFQVVPLEKERERFALWEIWQDQAAFYAHHEQSYTKNFSKRSWIQLNFLKAQKRFTCKMKLSKRYYTLVHSLLTSLVTTGLLTLLLHFLANGSIRWFLWLKTWLLVFVLITILGRFLPQLMHHF